MYTVLHMCMPDYCTNQHYAVITKVQTVAFDTACVMLSVTIAHATYTYAYMRTHKSCANNKAH
jgi:hypothetical protein